MIKKRKNGCTLTGYTFAMAFTPSCLFSDVFVILLYDLARPFWVEASHFTQLKGQKMIKNVIARQIKFQKNMNTDEVTMRLAVIEELGEFVASLGYADWKQVERDEKNMLVELMDIAIFAINCEYYVAEETKYSHKFIYDEEDLVDEIIAALAKENYKTIYMAIFDYEPKVLRAIAAKQALNQLRQDKGYKTGGYKKTWHGKEDNEYLEAVYDFDSYEIMYNELSRIYEGV